MGGRGWPTWFLGLLIAIKNADKEEGKRSVTSRHNGLTHDKKYIWQQAKAKYTPLIKLAYLILTNVLFHSLNRQLLSRIFRDFPTFIDYFSILWLMQDVSFFCPEARTFYRRRICQLHEKCKKFELKTERGLSKKETCLRGRVAEWPSGRN